MKYYKYIFLIIAIILLIGMVTFLTGYQVIYFIYFTAICGGFLIGYNNLDYKKLCFGVTRKMIFYRFFFSIVSITIFCALISALTYTSIYYFHFQMDRISELIMTTQISKYLYKTLSFLEYLKFSMLILLYGFLGRILGMANLKKIYGLIIAFILLTLNILDIIYFESIILTLIYFIISIILYIINYRMVQRMIIER